MRRGGRAHEFIRLPDLDDALYDFRTMAERVNARLKDEFGGRFVRVRGAIKVKCQLMFDALALAVDLAFRVASFAPAASLTGNDPSAAAKLTRSMSFARISIGSAITPHSAHRLL